MKQNGRRQQQETDPSLHKLMTPSEQTEERKIKDSPSTLAHHVVDGLQVSDRRKLVGNREIFQHFSNSDFRSVLDVIHISLHDFESIVGNQFLHLYV